MKDLTYQELKDKGLVEKTQAHQLEHKAQHLEYLADDQEKYGFIKNAERLRKQAQETRTESAEHLAIYYELREQALQIKNVKGE